MEEGQPYRSDHQQGLQEETVGLTLTVESMLPASIVSNICLMDRGITPASAESLRPSALSLGPPSIVNVLPEIASKCVSQCTMRAHPASLMEAAASHLSPSGRKPGCCS